MHQLTMNNRTGHGRQFVIEPIEGAHTTEPLKLGDGQPAISRRNRVWVRVNAVWIESAIPGSFLEAGGECARKGTFS